MKKNKTLIVTLFSLAFLFMGAGIILFLFTNPSNKTNKKIEKIEENRDYQKIEVVEGEQLNQTSTPSTFPEFAKKIGFEAATCEQSTAVQTCTAQKQGYTNSEKFMDIISVTYANDKIMNFTMSLYFYDKEYNEMNVLEKSNLVLENFFGTGMSSEQFISLNSELQNDMISDEPVVTKKFYAGEYTEDFNFQYIKKSKFYLVRIFVVPTAEYQ